MKAWPVLSIGIVAAALCCLLTPVVLAFLGVASLQAIAGDLFLPLLVGVGALVALALGLRAIARRQLRTRDRPHRKA